MSFLKWTNKSTRGMAEELERQGHEVSHVTVARCLREMGYSLQANVKTLEGPQVEQAPSGGQLHLSTRGPSESPRKA